jgi:hypothetical protein
MNSRVKGVRDLMDLHRFQWKHVAKEMMNAGIPGNWDKAQNVYNLVNGYIVPKDAYVYMVLAKMLRTDVETILSRYTVMNIINETLNPVVEERSIDFDEDTLF